MKRLFKLLTTALLVVSCAACGNSNSVSGIVNKDVVTPTDGYAEGGIGDTMRTAWFDFTVNRAELKDSYGSVVPNDGETLLVVNVTLNNTFTEAIPMFDSDFQAQWGADGDDDYRFPVTFDDPTMIEKGMLEAEYELGAGKTVTGDLVFSVPGGQSEYSLSFLEYYAPGEGEENGAEGDLFFVYFSAQ